MSWSRQYCDGCGNYFEIGENVVLSCSKDLFHPDCWEDHLEAKPERYHNDYEALEYEKLRDVLIAGKEDYW